MPFFNYGENLDQSILSVWTLGKQLGSEGKDGYVCKVTNDEISAVMKIFKNKKSIKKIRKEIEYYKITSNANLSPIILSNWEIEDNSKCFIMQPMKRTLLEIVKQQNNKLTPEQIERLLYLYTKLSELKILHNDSNILRNIMEGYDGKLYLIDFGFSKNITKKVFSEQGPNPNLSLLAELDHKLKTTYFSKLIETYENQYNYIIDYRKHCRKQIQERINKKFNL